MSCLANWETKEVVRQHTPRGWVFQRGGIGMGFLHIARPNS